MRSHQAPDVTDLPPAVYLNDWRWHVHRDARESARPFSMEALLYLANLPKNPREWMLTWEAAH